MYANSAADSGSGGNFAGLLSPVIFFAAFCCSVVDAHETAPLVVNLFVRNGKTAFRGALITFHLYIGKAVVAKNNRECCIPPLRVIYTQFIIRFIDNNGNG